MSASRSSTVSLIIPVYNEEGAIASVLRDCFDLLRERDDLIEIIIVDDGSTDGTAHILRECSGECLRVVSHEHNEGNGAAIISGVESTIGDAVATIDADGSYKPGDLAALLDEYAQGDQAMIVGERRDLGGAPIHHRAARSSLRKLGEVLTHQSIPDINSGMRIVEKELFLSFVKHYPRRFSLHIVLTLCCLLQEEKVRFVPISYHPRIGKSKLSAGLRGYGNYLKFIGLMIKTRFNTKPSGSTPHTESASENPGDSSS